MNALEFLHAVESFIGRDLSMDDGDSVIEMFNEDGYEDVQYVAELMMNKDDFRRVYGRGAA